MITILSVWSNLSQLLGALDVAPTSQIVEAGWWEGLSDLSCPSMSCFVQAQFPDLCKFEHH